MGELLVESVEHLKKLCMDAPNQKLQLVVYVSANSESVYQVMYKNCSLPWEITNQDGMANYMDAIFFEKRVSALPLGVAIANGKACYRKNCLSPQQIENYLTKTAHLCLSCGSDEITAEGFDLAWGNEVSQEVWCQRCNSRWTDVYKLSDVIPLEIYAEVTK